MQLVILVAICFSVAIAAPGISSGGDRSFPHDITSRSGLTALFNQPVIRAERVRRPKGSGTTISNNPLVRYATTHSGVRVTTEDGRQWLIHKGSGYGRSSETVVTDADHMSSRWRVESETPVTGHTVGDLVRTGGTNYGLITNNCHQAADRIMKQARN